MDTNWRNIRFSVLFKVLALALGLLGCYFFSAGLFDPIVRQYGPIPDADAIIQQDLEPEAAELSTQIYNLFYDPEDSLYQPDEQVALEKANQLAAAAGLSFTILENGTVRYGRTLSDTDYMRLPFLYEYQDYNYESSTDDNSLYHGVPDYPVVQIIITVPDATYEVLYTQAKARSQQTVDALKKMVLGIALMLVSYVWLCYVAGRTPRDQEVHLYLIDRLWTDVGLILTIVAVTLFLPLIDQLFHVSTEQYLTDYFGRTAYPLAAFGTTALPFLLITGWSVSATKHLKRREFWRSTLLVKSCIRLYHFLRGAFQFVFGRPHSLRFVLLLLAYSAAQLLLMAFFCLCIATQNLLGAWICFCLIAVALGAALHLLKKYTAAQLSLAEHVRIIRQGNLSHQIPFTGDATIDAIADDVNNLSEGLKRSVENEVAAQKMKVELITNVSHDLKTPLTSIISYVDLLSKEPQTNEKSKEYIAILQQKSNRLKTLIEDLFEVAKAESGNIEFHMERLCLNDLLEQALGEYEEKLKAAGLSVRLSGTEQKYYILADSNKLWRVFSNLLSNIVKYALRGSRVYIDIIPDQGYTWVCFKNISSYEMNFSADQIVERFQRGDPSRTTEGSGLGLAIVRSFMERMGGRCDVVIDGDLFKSLVLLLSAVPPEPRPQDPADTNFQ